MTRMLGATALLLLVSASGAIACEGAKTTSVSPPVTTAQGAAGPGGQTQQPETPRSGG